MEKISDKRALVIAQTPPPFHGQGIMQQYLVDAKWDWFRKDFVRMNFSDAIAEVGVFKFKKVIQLFDLIRRIQKSATSKYDLIYYPPAGPHRIPIYRDIIILFYLRMISRKVVLHFHAGGIDQIFKKVTKAEAYFIRKAFTGVDAVIVLSEWLKKDVEWCKPKKYYVVGNGCEDVFKDFTSKREQQEPVCFLFVGNLKKEKGIFTLLKSALLLKNRGETFIVKCIGSFHNEHEKNAFVTFISENGLDPYVQYLGHKSGSDKWKEFAGADVLCHPTYETEGMPVTILEAMMFQKPVITTRWRSIPDMIQNKANGLLFEPQNDIELADHMHRLIHNKDERTLMGERGRKDFLANYTIEKHLEKLEVVFKDMLTSD